VTLTIVNMIPRSLSREQEQDSEPNIAVNPANPRQIVATAFTPDPAAGQRAPIFVSTDGGLTWSPKVKVNATPANIPLGNQQAFTPDVSVNDAGTVAVSYYDFRNNTADAGATTPTDAWGVPCHAATEDCAASSSWDDEIRTTDVSFDSRQAPVARGFFLGDYVGLDNIANTFTPFFTQTAPTDPANEHYAEVGP